MALSLLWNNTSASEGWVIAGGASAWLTIHESTGVSTTVDLTLSGALAPGYTLSDTQVVVGSQPVLVKITATQPSTARSETQLELRQGGTLLATFPLTALSSPQVQFEGRYQCRLATDPDGFDHLWGSQSSFGMYAVQGPDPAHPFEPPLDRIIRFQGAVAARPFCPMIGVFVRRVRGLLAGGSPIAFDQGDTLLGAPVQLGPNCKFDAQDGAIAPPGFEPISDFRIEIVGSFTGESEPGLPRPDLAAPLPSTAPYADGFFRMDQESPLKPNDFGYPDANWTIRANDRTTTKLAALNTQVTLAPREVAIRDRRILEHTSNVGGVRFAGRMMERYTGKVHLNVTVTPGASQIMQAFAGMSSFKIYVEFFDFDTDCQSGTVWGTLG